MNIYQMYTENDNKAGFWVQRRTWGKTVALIKSIGGQKEGKLAGSAPYFSNPLVIADVYRVTPSVTSSGAQWELVDEDSELSCPGTYSYGWVREDWAEQHVPAEIQDKVRAWMESK